MSYEINYLEEKRAIQQIQQTYKTKIPLKPKENDKSLVSDTDSQIHAGPRYVGPMYGVEWYKLLSTNVDKTIPHRHKDTHPNDSDTDSESEEQIDSDQHKDYYWYHFNKNGWHFHFPDNVFLG